MQSLDRRKALTTLGMAGAVALVTPASVIAANAIATESGELAALMRRYWAEIDVFNATPHPTDKESDAHAASTYELTLSQTIGVRARTPEDALEAFKFIRGELGENERFGGDLADALTSLLDAVSGYISGRVA
jgi:hypothetical protein